jgi:hypothetical protein
MPLSPASPPAADSPRLRAAIGLALLGGLLAAPAAAALGPGLEDARCAPTAAAEAFAAAAFSPSDSVFEGRIVFVTFPDSRDSLAPVWADSMAASLAAYLADMSGGRLRTHVEVLRRPDAPGRAWRAPWPALEYARPQGRRWWQANRDVLAAVSAATPRVWAGVDQVWVVHDQCVFDCTDASSGDACEDTCPWAGIASLGVNPGDVPGLEAGGTTQRFLVRLPSPRQHRVQLHVAAHEFGHRVLGTPHSPGSDDPAAGWTNYGRYDVMRSGVNGSFAREEGLVPYHPLTLARWGWRGLVRVAADTAGVRLADLGTPRGAVVQVVPRRGTQSFALAHHAGRTPWDARYGGGGLHVWHVRRDGAGTRDLAWDLESAAGRQIPQGPMDAIEGLDPLEADAFALGSAADFFTPAGAGAFGPLTNPSSALYAGDERLAGETVPSGVAVEHLRTDPATGDLVVDVWVTPAQRVAPLAAAYDAGGTVPLRWDVRASAQAVAVDVALVLANGVVRRLASNLPNSGAWDWPADEVGDGLRLQLTSRTAAGEAGESWSAPFAVRGQPSPAPPALALARPRPQPAAGTVTLAFALPQRATAVLEVLDLTGRRVCTLASGEFDAGEVVRTWDGRDVRGARVPPAVYRARLVSAGSALERRIVWIE